MEVTKYNYSIKFGWFGTIFLSVIILFCFYAIITDPPGDNIWQLMIPAIIVIGGMLIYWGKICFIPALKGKIALELDKDKLQYFVSNKTVYWSDVESIDKDTMPRNGWIIIFSMLDRSKDIKIPTRFIVGKDEDIYNKVCEYAKLARPEIWLP